MTIEIEDASEGIQVHETPDYYVHPDHALQVACAMIGNSAILFEIFSDPVDDDTAYYYANGVPVSEEVYWHAFKTADKDRFCPGCAQSAEDEDALPMGHKHGGNA